MMSTKKFLVAAFVLFSLTFLSNPAFAIYPPQEQSGGQYFPGKGTRAAQDVLIDESTDYSYAKSEDGPFDYQRDAKGVRLGIAEIRPSLAYVGEYDSNIFLTEDDREDDYISRLLGGVDVYVPMQDKKYVVMGGVHNETEFFADHSGENHTDWTYQLAGEANFNNANIAVYEEFKDTSERSDSELTQRVQRYQNSLGGILTVPFGEFFSETEVSDFILNFTDSANFNRFDRHEFSVYPRLGMNVGKKTQALVEYGYTHISYDEQDDRDGNAHQALAGVRGLLGDGDLISYQLWGGWQFRYYDGSGLDDFNNFVAHGQMVYKASEITKIILEGIRRPEESMENGQTFYTRNELGLRVKRQIAEDWFASARFGTGFNHYNNDRLDFIWEPGVGLEYVLPGKILSLFTEYKFTGRNSDDSTRDYGRHIANFGVKAAV